jgi:HSP20 family molecular chaperone IbpA
LAIKKGFLNNNKKSGLYEEKIPTIRPKNQPESLPPLPPSDADKKKPSEEEELINKMTSSLNLDSSSSAHSASGNNTNDKEAPVNVASEMKAVSTKRKIVEKAAAPEAVVPPPAPSVTEEKAAAQTSTPEETKKGPVEPVVVVKHREEFSLGDFQGMNKELAKSQRPTELVYEIQLPLAHSPSKISLDVSERRICLTYLDVYKLDMKLPYKVNDKKGKAAYDKNKKVLKVSLPVVSEEPLLTTATTAGGSSSVSPLSSPVKPPVSAGKIVEEIQSKENDEQDEGSSSSPSKTAAGKTKTGAASHNRWVEKKDTVTTTAANDQAAEESRKLYEDIKKQAEVARANALAQAANPPAPKTIPPVRSPPPKSTTVSFSSSSQSTPETPTEAFIASKTFAGAKSGYIFQNGNQGVGYYVDPSIVLANAAKEKEQEQEKQEKKVELSEKSIDQLSTKKISDLQEELTSNTTAPSSQSQQIQYQLPSVEIKQTKEAVSILFQVSEINSSSVKIQFTSNYLFEVRFARGKDGEEHFGIAFELDEKVCQQGVNPSSVQFDVASKNMVVVLLKNAPQIYQNNTSNKVEIIKISSETAKNSQQSWLQYKEIPSSTTTIADPVPSSNDKGEEKKEADVVPPETTKGKKSAKGKESATSKSLATEVFKSTVSNFQFNTDFISELD